MPVLKNIFQFFQSLFRKKEKKVKMKFLSCFWACTCQDDTLDNDADAPDDATAFYTQDDAVKQIALSPAAIDAPDDAVKQIDLASNAFDAAVGDQNLLRDLSEWTDTIEMTAYANIKSDYNEVEGGIFFDTGSDRSYITPKMATLLKLEPIRKENLIILGFDESLAVFKDYDVVQFSIIDVHGRPIPIKAIVDTSRQRSYKFDGHRAKLLSLSHLKNLNVAHPVSDKTEFDVDIKIGIDYYWDIVGDKVVRGPGPTAIDSRLGYLISGPFTLYAPDCRTVKQISPAAIDALDDDAVKQIALSPAAFDAPDDAVKQIDLASNAFYATVGVGRRRRRWRWYNRRWRALKNQYLLRDLSRCGKTISITAYANIKSDYNEVEGGIFLDTGACRSLITPKMATLLKLEPIRKEKLIILGFDESLAVFKDYDVVQFSIIDLHGRPIPIEAIVDTRTQCSFFDGHRAKLLSLSHLKNLNVAHPVSDKTEFDVDILIGIDYYWDIVGDRIVRGPGLTAVDSRLGYLISGPFITN